MSYDNNLVSTNTLTLFPFFQGKMLQINNYCSLCRRHSCTSYLATQKLGQEEINRQRVGGGGGGACLPINGAPDWCSMVMLIDK